MSFLNALINNVEDEVLREDLQERVDIILHKIKFMDKVPVTCLDTNNTPNHILNVLIETVGGEVLEIVQQAKVLIYHQTNVSIGQMMGLVPALLEKEWPAVAYNRVYLLEDTSAFLSDPLSFVEAMEDMAEMLYPGYFIFGNEGKSWTAFAV